MRDGSQLAVKTGMGPTSPTTFSDVPRQQGDTLDAALIGALRQRLSAEFAEALAAGVETSFERSLSDSASDSTSTEDAR